MIIVHGQCGRKHFVQRQHAVQHEMKDEIIEGVQMQRCDLTTARINIHNVRIENGESATVEHLFGFRRQRFDGHFKFDRFG